MKIHEVEYMIKNKRKCKILEVNFVTIPIIYLKVNLLFIISNLFVVLFKLNKNVKLSLL